VVAEDLRLRDSLLQCREELERHFSPREGFGAIRSLNVLDGLRITFAEGDVAHFRPSGNAPQLRLYTASDTLDRAEQILARGLAEPDGILRRMERALDDGSDDCSRGRE
jgi:phosphomannomutase